MKHPNILSIAKRFGSALDHDDFPIAQELLAENCTYNTGKEVLKGASNIIDSYRNNMLEGRKKLDELIWGKSYVEQLNDKRMVVYFTDYLKHNGLKHTHRCKQVLTFNQECKIIHIEHQNISGEPEALAAYYQSCGLG